MKTKQQTLGKEAVIKLYETKWWEQSTKERIAEFQLFTAELCCPFGIFHEALEHCLKRPVFTHEIAMNFDGIVAEFLCQRGTPTLEEILSLVPESKQIVVIH